MGITEICYFLQIREKVMNLLVNNQLNSSSNSTHHARNIIVKIDLFSFTQYLFQDNCQEMALEVLWSHHIFDRLKTGTGNFVLCYCEQSSCKENPDYQGCKFDRQIDICWQSQCPPNFLRHFPHNCINLP